MNYKWNFLHSSLPYFIKTTHFFISQILMRAVTIEHPGGPEVLTLGTYDTPVPGAEEILIEVAATALNRADTLQRQGKYPPPPGASPVLGLEVAGTVAACGQQVSQWQVGDRVMALLPGGGYAEYAVIHEALAMPVPDPLDFEHAAAIPEVFLTAFQALAWLAKLQNGEQVLIHAGASGVGTASIQLAREMGATSWVTASAPKHEACLKLGAAHAIDYRATDFVPYVLEHTEGKGIEVIVDFIGAPYFQQNLDALARDGRLILLALMGGVKTEVNLAPVLMKRLQIIGSTLRSRSLAYKSTLVSDFRAFAGPRLTDGRLQPVVDSVWDWQTVAEAHRYMEANQNIGKIILKVS